MDVDRLMRDLTVEQLENIQQNLEKEMEGKRESLREMVGRRYRDVLEASSEVRHVCSLAEKLASNIANTRVTYQSSHIRSGGKDEQKAVEHLYAVNYLISSIGNDGGEPLDDVVAFCMIEHLQKQLISNHSSPIVHKNARALTNHIVETRSELEYQNTSTLIDISRPDWATNQLAAIALLQGKDIGQLLDLYLEKRYEYIIRLIEDSATILSIVDEIKKTLGIVEELFVHGELIHAIHSVCNGQYTCELIREMCADQSFAFEKTINEDMDRVWRQMREKLSGRGAGTLPSQLVGEKCSDWIDRTCAVTHKLVAEVCEYFDSLDQVIDLLQAITVSLKQDWPRIGSCRSVYDKLLQTAVVDKAKVLLIEMITSIEISAKKRFESTNDGPPTAIFDDRTYRPDSNSHIGISTQLYKCVKTLWESLEQMNEKCFQFEVICAPMADMTTATAMKETMATNVLQLLLRLCELHSDKQSGSARFLARARLALALIHSESSFITTLLDKDSQRITSLNQRLHSIIEKNLGDFCEVVVDEHVTASNLAEYLESFEGGMYALRLVMEFQTVELPDVGEVTVPIALSPALQTILFDISSRLAEASIAHLLTKKIRKRLDDYVSNKMAELIGNRVEEFKEGWNLPTRSTLQVLFDCQLLSVMFPGEKIRMVCSSIESHLDPFDVSLLSPILSTNVKLVYTRTQVLFSCMVADTMSNKEVQLPQSFSKIQDLAVHIEQPSRIPMVPRLDRTMSGDKKNGGPRLKNNKYLSNPSQQGSSKSTPSLSAFYDRISSSWFGGANN